VNGNSSPEPGSVVLGGSLLGRLRAPFSDPTVDPRVRQTRLGAGLYLAACVVGAATIPLLPASVHQRWMWIMVAASALAAVGLVVLPWARWPDRAILVPLCLGPVMIGVGVGGLAHGLLYYLPLYGLSFVFAGVTQRPGTSLLLAPVALLSGWSALLTHEEGQVLVPLIIMVGISTMLGELIAGYVRLQRIAGDTLDELLMGVAGLTGCRTVAEVSDLAAAVVSRLLESDMTLLLLPETEGSSKFVYGGGVGMTAEINESLRGSVVIDSATSPSGTGLAAVQRRMIFVPVAKGSPLVQQQWLEEQDIASVVFLPLIGRPGVVTGVVIAGFHRQRRSLDTITARGLSMLGEATGRVVDQLRQAEQLAREAETDALTGLANRRVFFRELLTMTQGDVVVFVDLDHFKDLNDTLGHAAGDRELAAFGTVLREQVRDSDLAARYGGEEFAVLVRGGGRTGAELLVARLREEWDRRSSTTFSVGAALHEPEVQPSGTLAAADRAVYAAKATGRDRMCWADGPESFGAAARVSAFGLASVQQRHRRMDDVTPA
jgi:diguanylate cyclase (GGDEF)-like protein